MVAAELDVGDDGVVAAMPDRWLDDGTLPGLAGRVRDGFEARFDTGVANPIVVPSLTSVGQATAMQELPAAFA